MTYECSICHDINHVSRLENGHVPGAQGSGAVSHEHRNIIRRFDSDLWKKGEHRPSQGDMRSIRDSGLAIEHPDHTFTLTDSGRAVLTEERKARAHITPKGLNKGCIK